ncbi:MAG: hypothetical protein ACEPOZ_19105 [Marinifilaceae bacterium]
MKADYWFLLFENEIGGLVNGICKLIFLFRESGMGLIDTNL